MITNLEDRRVFLENTMKMLGLGLCAPVISAILSSCEYYLENPYTSSGNFVEIDINASTRLKNFVGWGDFHNFQNMNYGVPLIIMRLKKDPDPDTEPGDLTKYFVCFSSLCTHASCYGPDNITKPSPSFPAISCNCHGSKFDPYDGGKVLLGPAEKPLQSYPTQYDPKTKILKIFY